LRASVGQPDVILSKGSSRGVRFEKIFQLCSLQSGANVAILRQTMQQGGHPPGKTFGFPDACQCAAGILIKFGGIIVCGGVELDQGIRKVMNITGRQVQTLCSGRWNDMCGVAGQKQRSEPHRFGDKAAQWRNAFFNSRSGDQCFGGRGIKARFQFIPEACVGPLLDRIGKGTLDVTTAARGRAHAAKGESAFVIDVDEFFRHRRRVGQQSDPAERIDPFIISYGAFRYAGATYAVETVTAGDEVASEFARLTILAIPHPGVVCIEVKNFDVTCFINSHCAACLACIHQVARDFGLTIDDNLLATGRLSQIDAVTRSREANVKSGVDQAF